MKCKQSIFRVILLALITTVHVEGYKILFLAPFPVTSHWFLIENIIIGLLENGHEVTAITNNILTPKSNYTSLTRYKEILIDPPLDVFKHIPQEIIFSSTDDSVFTKQFSIWGIGLMTSKHALATSNVKQFLRTDKLKFDLIIAEEFYQESWLMFAYKYKAPLATISNFGYANYFDRSMGLLSPISFVPHHFLEYSDEMTFYERCMNTFVEIFDYLGRKYYYLPKQQEIANEAFGFLEHPGKPLPSIVDLNNKKSLILINSHRSIDNPRPKMPGMVDIGGLNFAKRLKPIPNDIKQFLDDANNGVIYFSWGTIVHSSSLPNEKLRVFINTFKSIKQRILWKWDTDDLKDIPSNVMIRKWIPQFAILSHPNVVLFMSHGGLLGVQQSLYCGVPILSTPFFGDHHHNAAKAERIGYGLSLYFNDISEINLKSKLNDLLERKKYSKKAKEISKIFRDNFNDPLEEAIYWIEYVIRHKGANHLKSHAVNLNILQYLLLDVLGLFSIISIMSFLFFIRLIQVIIRNKTEYVEIEKIGDSSKKKE